MLAWHLSESPGQYEWGEVPTPEPGPDEVRVKVRASALNHMDVWLTSGLPKPRSFPHVPGNDVAGEVDRIGEQVEGWRPGDEVVVNTALVPRAALARGVDSVLDPDLRILGEHCWGGHGEFCVVPAHSLERRPAGRSWAEAASYPVAATTAWRLLRRARVQPEDTVLITGIGGGVATAAMVLAQQIGARVFVTSRDEKKRKRALVLGAEDAFDSDGPYPVSADVVIDSIGPATWKHAIRTLRHGGRMCICGGTSGQKVELELPRLFFKQLDIIGGTCGSQEEFQHVTALMEAGLPVLIDDVLPLSEFPAALDRLRSGQQLGKLVIEHPSPT